MKNKKINWEIVKRALIFLLMIALLTGGLFLFAWLRGPTTPEEPTTRSTILYYMVWAFVLWLIYYVTKLIMKGKKSR